MMGCRPISRALGLLLGAVLGITSLGQISVDKALADGFDVVGHLGGAPNVLVTHAGYLYLGVGPELAVFRVAGATPGIRIGYLVFPGMVQDIALTSDGTYAGVAAQAAGFWLVDLTQPATPRAVALMDMPALGVAIAGHYAYVAGDTGLQIVDITQPEDPSAVGALETPGCAMRVTVYRDHAYIAQTVCPSGMCRASLLVVDVSDPSRPVAMGSLEVEGWAAQVDVAVVPGGGYVYLAAGMAGMRVIDVSNPLAPVEVAVWVPDQPLPNVWRVQIIGDRAWLADSAAGLYVVDVSNPGAPALVASYAESGGVVDVAGDSSSVYLITQDSLVVLDVTDAKTPRLAASRPLLNNAERLVISAGTAYVAGEHTLWAVDIGDPAAPTLLGSHAFARGVQALALGQHLSGNFLLAAIGDCDGGPCNGSLVVLDVTEAAQPNVMSAWQPEAGYPVGLATGYEFAYLAGRDAGLWVLDLSSLESPQYVATLPLPGFAMDVAAPGAFAYVAARGGRLCVVDLHPRVPILASVLPPPDEFWSVATNDGYAYLGDRTFGLRVVDVADPSAPREIGFVDPTGNGGIEDVVFTESTVYAAIGYDGLRAIDVADPASPIEVRSFDTPGAASAVVVEGDLVYVADGLGGLFVLR